MESSEKLKQWIRRHEQFSARAYVDGYDKKHDKPFYSIGYGHQIQPGDNLDAQSVITQDRAEAMLEKDLKYFETYVNISVQLNLNQPGYDALVNLNYAVGPGTVISSGLYAALNSKNDLLAIHIWSYLGTMVNGKFCSVNAQIRNHEIDMFFDGIYPIF